MSRYAKYIFIVILLAAPSLTSAKTLTYGDQTWTINDESLEQTESLYVRNNFNLTDLVDHVLFGKTLTSQFPALTQDAIDTIAKIETEVNQPVTDAQLQIKDNWATTFVPDQNGQAVDVYALALTLTQNSDSAELPVTISKPSVRLGDLNTLGINELVAVGKSDFTGSSGNRITNVTVGSSKYNGLIIMPGQEFSFNQYLGDIDAAHGFKPEQVIKASGIELEFGGGLCQVSTTMFRAAMNAGLPITERRNHSFAVHYYYPQGTDATIYPGASDLKFVNDYTTPVLVRTYVEKPYVYFEMYGTKDGREVTFEGPVQYDRKPDGSMKATWTRHVTKNGQTTTYIARSNYVSPNLFKKVDQASTPNPQATATPANQPVNSTSTQTKT